MNILVFISSLLLILSFTCASILHGLAVFSTEKACLIGQLEGVRKTRNICQNRLFISNTKAPTPQHAAELKIPKKIENYVSHRKNKIKNNLCKLNLAALIVEDQAKNLLLRQTLASLLSNLYCHSSFIKQLDIKNWQDLLIQEMIKAGKNCIKPKDLLDLYPSEPVMKAIYYKILRGSGDYDMDLKDGYPPLSDFVFIDEKERKPIYFNYASYPVLTALFGQDVADHIIDLEEEKSKLFGGRRVLTKTEISNILLSSKISKEKALEMEHLLIYSQRAISLDAVTSKDTESGVYFLLPL
jgi:hypothetical protein